MPSKRWTDSSLKTGEGSSQGNQSNVIRKLTEVMEGMAAIIEQKRKFMEEMMPRIQWYQNNPQGILTTMYLNQHHMRIHNQ